MHARARGVQRRRADRGARFNRRHGLLTLTADTPSAGNAAHTRRTSGTAAVTVGPSGVQRPRVHVGVSDHLCSDRGSGGGPGAAHALRVETASDLQL